VELSETDTTPNEDGEGEEGSVLQRRLVMLIAAETDYAERFFPIPLAGYQVDEAAPLVSRMRTAAVQVGKAWTHEIVQGLPGADAARTVVAGLGRPVSLRLALKAIAAREALSLKRLARWITGGRWPAGDEGPPPPDDVASLVSLLEAFLESSSVGDNLHESLRTAVHYAAHFRDNAEREGVQADVAREWLEEISRVSTALESDLASQRSRVTTFSLYSQIVLSRRLHTLTGWLMVLAALGIVATLAVTFR
jgi:hypothetical protein